MNNKIKWRKAIIENAIKIINNRVKCDNDVFLHINVKKNYIHGSEYRSIINMYQDTINYDISCNLLGTLFVASILTTSVDWRYRGDINLKNTPELAVLLSVFTKEQLRKILIASENVTDYNNLNLSDRQADKLKKFHSKNSNDVKKLYLNILNNILKHNGNFDLH